MSMTTTTSAVLSSSVINPKYIILEDDITYDWDDYYVWGATLYELATGKVITTSYGHGTDMEQRKEAVTIEEAINNNIISADDLFKAVLKSFPIYAKESLEDIACQANLNNPIAIPVKVVRGRKFKGNGYLIYANLEPVRYGLGAYHNEYNRRPVIVNPEDGTINQVNSFGYLEFNIDNTAIREAIYNKMEHTAYTIAELAHWWAYNMSYSHCDSENARSLAKEITRKGFDFSYIPEVISDAIDAENARIAAAEEAKMNEKLPSIIEWVKKNTDKTTDAEILELAKHIYHKYNH